MFNAHIMARCLCVLWGHVWEELYVKETCDYRCMRCGMFWYDTPTHEYQHQYENLTMIHRTRQDH